MSSPRSRGSGDIPATRDVALCLIACFLAGVGAVLGSMLGHAFGPVGLRFLGVAGGIAGVVVATSIARRRGWIPKRSHGPATVGGCAGFLVAAFIATHSLSSPIGPVLSVTLIGMGAVAGARLSHSRRHVGEGKG